MMSPVISLRMFRADELGYFDRDRATDDPYNFFGHRSSASIVRRFAEDGLVTPTDGILAVDLDGTVIGDVQWRPQRYGPPDVAFAPLNIGIALDPAVRGRGYGAAAQRLLAEHLFAVYAVHRVEASTDVENVAEQRALLRAGFRREGVARGAQFRGGSYHDMVIFARLRDDEPSSTDAAG